MASEYNFKSIILLLNNFPALLSFLPFPYSMHRIRASCEFELINLNYLNQKNMRFIYKQLLFNLLIIFKYS